MCALQTIRGFAANAVDLFSMYFNYDLSYSAWVFANSLCARFIVPRLLVRIKRFAAVTGVLSYNF